MVSTRHVLLIFHDHNRCRVTEAVFHLQLANHALSIAERRSIIGQRHAVGIIFHPLRLLDNEKISGHDVSPNALAKMSVLVANYDLAVSGGEIQAAKH